MSDGVRRPDVQEYQEGNKNIVVDKTDIKQTVYIYK